MQVSEKILPLYTVYYYTDFLYRVVKFKRCRDGLALHDLEQEPQERFLQSYSRSRSKVLQYALCNEWDYYVTITVDPKRFDRWDLDVIWEYLCRFFRFYSRNYSRLSYLLVPERHKDGAWHFHGFLAGVLDSHLFPFVPGLHPQKLIDAGYVNFPALGQVIGYVSLGKIQDPVKAGFYVTKYITKEHAHDDFYQHLYYHSQGLKSARPVADCYTSNFALDDCLTFESDFVCCGWARLKSSDFTFPFDLDGCEPREFEHLTPFDAAVLGEDTTLDFVYKIFKKKGTACAVPMSQSLSQLCQTFCTSSLSSSISMSFSMFFTSPSPESWM
nr:hypothetical protein [uncultured Oscillibacter sp.]